MRRRANQFEEQCDLMGIILSLYPEKPSISAIFCRFLYGAQRHPYKVGASYKMESDFSILSHLLSPYDTTICFLKLIALNGGGGGGILPKVVQ